MSVSDNTVHFVKTVINVWLYLVLSLAGIVINAIHLSVSLRIQNFDSGFTIPISSLCAWNMLRCLFVFLHRLHGPMMMISKPYGVSWRNISGPYLDLFETTSVNVTFVLIAFLTLTRCLYVSKPFSVKSLLTPRFTTVMMVSISTVLFAAYFVMYFSFTVTTEFNADLNTTIFLCEYSDLYLSHGDILNRYYIVLSVTLPTLALCIIIISSAVTWISLKRSFNSDFLKARNKQNSLTKTTFRDKVVIKMMVLLIIIFIWNILPHLSFRVAQLAEPDFFILHKHHNTYLLLFRLLIGFDLLNSCLIFFICLVVRSSFRSYLKCPVCLRT